MALFRRLFYRKPPDRLLEISERVYVFDCCFSTDVLDEEAYKDYMGAIVTQLQDFYPDASFMVFNFREGDRRSRISDILSQYDMTVMEYPRQFANCPLLPFEMIYHFLQSSESWLSLEGQQNVLLMHCERGGWSVLAFVLAALLLHRKQYSGEQRTLEMIYNIAPKELLQLSSPLNPKPSHMRYLQYISIKNIETQWPLNNTPLFLDHLILKSPPLCNTEQGFRPVARVFGQDPVLSNRNTKLLFSSLKKRRHNALLLQMDQVKLDIRFRVQGDVVLECVYLSDTKEEMMFRVMFHTGFVRSNTLLFTRDEVDVMWDAKDTFPEDFKVEVHFLDHDAAPYASSTDVDSEDEEYGEDASPEEFYEVEEIFNKVVDNKFEECASDDSNQQHTLDFALDEGHRKSSSSSVEIGALNDDTSKLTMKIT